MKDSLFNEFPEISSKQWKQQIQFDLKGLDYNEHLIWRNLEGIDVKPFYKKSDTELSLELRNNDSDQWKITQTIYVFDEVKSNINAKDQIERGAESILFIIPNENVNLDVLLLGIDSEKNTIQFKFKFLSEKFSDKLKKYSSDSFIIHTDIIGNLLKTGNWFTNLSHDHDQLEEILKKTKSLSIDLALYQNAGSTMIQQLAYGIGHLNEYLNHIENKNLRLNPLQVHINVSVGSNYFFEIAKLRALRILIDSLIQLYSIEAQIFIHASPTKRNKTLYDYNTNMLRTTTECMSSALGGADYICNMAYDSLFHKSNEFGERISRNQLLILKHESSFNKLKNVADGTYYINVLTDQLAEKSLVLFKDIEQNGGFLKAIKEGSIQKKIKESAEKQQEHFNSGLTKLVGTNIHKNDSDYMVGELELYPFIKKNIRKTLIEPILENRLSESLEQSRLKNEEKEA